MTDPIADLLTRIRNAIRAGHGSLRVPRSKLKVEIVRILKDEGFVEDFKVVDEGPQGWIRVFPVQPGQRGGPSWTAACQQAQPSSLCRQG